MSTPINYSIDELIYPIADLLSMEIHLVGDKWRSAGLRKIPVWLFEVNAEIMVCSDIISAEVCTFLVKVSGDLWFYVISKPNDLKMVVFDGAVIGIRAKDMAGFNNQSVEAALSFLKPAIRQTLVFNQNKWELDNASNMDKDTSECSV